MRAPLQRLLDSWQYPGRCCKILSAISAAGFLFALLANGDNTPNQQIVHLLDYLPVWGAELWLAVLIAVTPAAIMFDISILRVLSGSMGLATWTYMFGVSILLAPPWPNSIGCYLALLIGCGVADYRFWLIVHQETA